MTDQKQPTKYKNLDRTGIAFSTACAIHCLFLPVLASLSPAFSNYLQNEWIHRILLVLLIPVAFISLFKSRKVHGNNLPVVLGTLGVILLLSGVAVESLHIEVPYLEKIVTSLGSLSLVAGHILNMMSFKKARQCC